MPLPQQSSAIYGTPAATPLAVSRVYLKPRPEFLLGFPPESFELFELPDAQIGDIKVTAGSYWLPTPVIVRKLAGANGVRTPNAGEDPGAAWTPMLQDWQSTAKGVILDPSTPVPADCLPPGAPAGGYVRRIDSHYKGVPGETWLTPWDVVEPVPGSAPARVKFDRTHYGLWLYWLVATEQIPAVHAHYISEKQRQTQERIQATQAQPWPSDVAREHRLAPLVAQADAETKAAAPTPAKKGGRRG